MNFNGLLRFCHTGDWWLGIKKRNAQIYASRHDFMKIQNEMLFDIHAIIAPYFSALDGGLKRDSVAGDFIQGHAWGDFRGGGSAVADLAKPEYRIGLNSQTPAGINELSDIILVLEDK